MSSSQQKPTPSLALWELLLTGEEPAMSKVKPDITPSVRQKLVDEGLIELEKRGRSTHILLTDGAWNRALDDLVVEGSRSPYGNTVLQHLLKRVQQYLDVNNISLAEFLRSKDPAPLDSDSDSEQSAAAVEDKIRAAYTKASQGSYNVRVKLAELRKYLSEFSRTQIDQALGKMELEENLVLMTLNDPQEIDAEDEAAAVDVGGQKRHIVYVKE